MSTSLNAVNQTYMRRSPLENIGLSVGFCLAGVLIISGVALEIIFSPALTVGLVALVVCGTTLGGLSLGGGGICLRQFVTQLSEKQDPDGQEGIPMFATPNIENERQESAMPNLGIFGVFDTINGLKMHVVVPKSKEDPTLISFPILPCIYAALDPDDANLIILCLVNIDGNTQGYIPLPPNFGFPDMDNPNIFWLSVGFAEEQQFALKSVAIPILYSSSLLEQPAL